MYAKGKPAGLFWPRALLGIASGLSSACTLTSDDFHPLMVDSIAVEGSVAGSPPPACTRSCGAAPNPALPDPAGNPVASPAGGSAETAAPPLPLESPVAPNSGASPTDANTPAAGPAPATTDPAMAADPPTEAPDEATEPEPAAPDEATEPEPTAPAEAPEPLDSDLTLIGWAAVDGLGTPTTTGGAAGATVTATTAEQLADFASRPEPLTILVAGTLRVERLQVSSDKTLRGVGPSPRIEGGLRIRGKTEEFVRNVIVQNLTVLASFSDVEGDGVQIYYAHHVWVDHCDVQDAPDGNLDIVHGSDFITVSWSRFSYTPDAEGKRLSTQIGHSDSASATAEDTGHLRVTLHHNFWDAGVIGSMPSARFGDVHIFNNYYASPEAETAITAGLGSRLLVENNYFENMLVPYRMVGGTAPEPQLVASGNVVTAAAATLEAVGTAFVPPYPYLPEAADAVPERVRAAAGATLGFAAPDP